MAKLLKNMTCENGTYYRKVGGKRIANLGRDRDAAIEAQRLWLANKGAAGNEKIIRVGLRKYEAEILPSCSESYQVIQKRAMKDIDIAFGHMEPVDVKPSDIQILLNQIAKRSLSLAHQSRRFLCVFFDYLMLWDYMPHINTTNPARLTKLDAVEAKDRLVTEAEFWGVFKIANTRMRIAMLMARGTAMREMDMLTKLKSDFQKDGILNVQSKRQKGKKKRKQKFTPNAYTAMALSLSMQLHEECPSDYLLPTEKGKHYTQSGFISAFSKRLIPKAIRLGVITESFSYHDLRRMAGSEQKSSAQTAELLGNTEAVARKHYRVGYELVSNQAAPQDVEALKSYIKEFETRLEVMH